MKRLLITGASGFIGSFIVEEAINSDFDVSAGVRKTSSRTYLTNTNITFFEVDLLDKQLIKKKLLEYDRFDYIIHSAGITKTCDKNLFNKINIDSTQNLIEALQETSRIPDKFVFISSLAAYGPAQNNKQAIKLEDTPKPTSLYGVSKLITENYIKSIKDFPYLIFRPTGVYGPREKDYFIMFKSVNSGIETYIGSKEQSISFIYVKDIAELLIKVLKSGIIRKSYFVSDLQDYTAVEFNRIIAEKLHKKTIKIVFPRFFVKALAFIGEKISCVFSGNVPTLNTDKYKDISHSNWLCDSSDLVTDFNFRPQYDLKKGVSEAIDWYKKKGML